MAEFNIESLTEDIKKHSEFVDKLKLNLHNTIVGQDDLIQKLIIAILSDGHVFLEGVPGLAKTLTVKTMASLIDTQFQRIQFTPDLLPADILGTLIFNPKEAEFEIKKGPIFSNIILADEINRAPAKVQSALLEAMQERQITIGEESFKLDEILKKRKEEWETEQHRWREGDSPPYLLSETIMTAKEGARLQGVGISPGVVKAKARVLHSLDDASQLKPGEILVVRSTDPAWTPLFWPASGIILELGGMLSHGAIVARECRTPAVSGIPNVTKIIKTGQSIQMDGRRGWVFLDV